MTNKLVFFVDDDKMILNLLEYTFKSRDGIQVKTFFSGEECLDNMHLMPDLVVVDHMFIGMKGQMNGLQVVKKIREINQEVTILVLSSQEDEDIIADFINSGAKQYISKDDYFIDTLIETIEAEVRSVS
ncbi:MAG: response regulator [Bacteroidales bacterium]|nr:response regulator [Bacteroidales bacterium]